MTFPTGVVTNLHGDMSSGAVAVDIETSGRDEDVSITTNLSSIDSFYTLVQGKALLLCVCGCFSEQLPFKYESHALLLPVNHYVDDTEDNVELHDRHDLFCFIFDYAECNSASLTVLICLPLMILKKKK